MDKKKEEEEKGKREPLYLEVRKKKKQDVKSEKGTSIFDYT
jgi:hypothetical protein